MSNTNYITSITVIPASATLEVGQSTYFEALISPSEAEADCCFLWSCDDPEIAIINPESGAVYAEGVGSTTVRATATDGSGVEGTATLTVHPPIPVEGITLSHIALSLYQGNTTTLSATAFPSNASNRSVRFSSNDTTIVTVLPTTGFVTARGAGEAVITCEALDGSGVKAYCTVSVAQTILCCAEETPANTVTSSLGSAPAKVYSGAYQLSIPLLSLFGGQNLSLVAHYDSTQLSKGMLGVGWSHSFEKHVEVYGSEALVFSNPSIYAPYAASSDAPSRYVCSNAGKAGYVLTVDHSETYPYVLDCNHERTELYDADGNLAKIIDHEGFETLITYTDTRITVTDDVSGKRMHLEFDEDCRIGRVYDDHGRETYLCYTENMLTSVSDPNENCHSFTYDTQGRILTATDGNDTRYVENTYDNYGRLSLQKDARSLTTRFEYNGNKRIITDRNGKIGTYTYNDKALLIRYTDANGNTTSYEYDEAYNVTKETNAANLSVIKTYNSFHKPTQITNRRGEVTTFTYDENGNLTEIRYPPINGVVPVESFAYYENNQIKRHTDLRGTVTVYEYDTNGMPKKKKVGNRNATVYTYVAGLLKSQTDPENHTTSYGHNALGQVTSITDAHSKTTTFTYDLCGNPLTTLDPLSKSTATVYDGNYRKISFTDQNGNRTLYSYDGNGWSDTVTFPDSSTVRYTYDGEGRTATVTDQENNVTTYTYDAGGRLLSKKLPDNATFHYEYDRGGNVIREINPKGALTVRTFDGLGNPLTVTEYTGHTTVDGETVPVGTGSTTTYEYNAINKVKRVVNAVAGSTVCVYSAAGDLLSETDALGHTRSYTYDAYGNRLTETDARGNTVTYTYDQNNNLHTVKDPFDRVTTYTYDALNRCETVTDAKNNVVSYGYDALGRRTTVTDARENVFTTLYDGNGNVIKTIDAKNNRISETVYNSLNLPYTVTDAMGKVTTYTYNGLGKVETVTDPLYRTSLFSYNSRALNTSVRDAANGISTAAYDTLGNITRLAGPLGAATVYTYDNMGRLVTESTVSSGTKAYEYNALNLPSKITNAKNQETSFFYDAAGKTTGYTSPEGTVSYTYDAAGNLLTVTDSHGTITRTYDELNRVSSYTDTYGKLIRYEYDEVGNLSKIIYPDNTAVSYAYDANHNLTCVTDWANRVTSYTYDENNRVTSVTKPDGSVTTTIYDNMQRVTSTVERTAGGAVIIGYEYTYDDLSRIIEEKVLANSTKLCYTYDTLSRVIKRTVKNFSNVILSEESFSYDAAGNLTDAPDCCFEYDLNNRLSIFNGEDTAFDADGNLLSDGVNSFAYDSANRLVSADGHTYTYNAEGIRIRNLSEDEDTTYTYDTNAKLSRLLTKTTDGTVTKYVYGRGLIGEEANNTFKTYHFDARGSTVAITSASGSITDTFAYDTYGALLSRTGTSEVIFGYNGRDGVVTDSNGLIYMRTRYYSPDMKRFVNADIVAGEISNAITLNRFAYANGNPAMFIDPLGLRVVAREPQRLSSALETTTTEAEDNIAYEKAVLVSRFNDGGLRIVGHTELYFLGSDQNWYMTEFDGDSKSEAQVAFYNASIDHELAAAVSEFYNSETGFVKNPKGINYVVLEGDFSKSVALARRYAAAEKNNNHNEKFGRYNFLFHNCSDYTDELLGVANIDGMSSQMHSETFGQISIPVLREVELSVAAAKDSGIKWASNGLFNWGKSMIGSNVFGNVAGLTLIGAGAYVNVATNSFGDAVDVAIDYAGKLVAPLKENEAKRTNVITDIFNFNLSVLKSISSLFEK